MDASKVAAIGIRARRWITYHGLALNVTTDLGPYRHIIPCGIRDRPVTSVATIAGRHNLSDDSLLAEYAQALLSALHEVFDLEYKIASADELRNDCNGTRTPGLFARPATIV